MWRHGDVRTLTNMTARSRYCSCFRSNSLTRWDLCEQLDFGFAHKDLTFDNYNLDEWEPTQTSTILYFVEFLMLRKYMKYKPVTVGHLHRIFYMDFFFFKYIYSLKLNKNVDADFMLQWYNTETYRMYSKSITIHAKTHLGTLALVLRSYRAANTPCLTNKGCADHPASLTGLFGCNFDTVWKKGRVWTTSLCTPFYRKHWAAEPGKCDWSSGVIVQSHGDSTSPTGMSDLYPSEEEPDCNTSNLSTNLKIRLLQ